MGRPFGTPQSKEARKKIGIGSKRAWKEQKKRGLVNRGAGQAIKDFYDSPEGQKVKRSIAKKVKISWKDSKAAERRCRRMSIAKKDVKQTPEAIAARVPGIRRSYLVGRKPAGPNGWHKRVYKDVVYSSSYELAFVKWCLRNKIKFLYQPIRFVLEINGTYRPDFYLPDCNFWLEIKGAMLSKPMAKYFEFKRIYTECPV